MTQLNLEIPPFVDIDMEYLTPLKGEYSIGNYRKELRGEHPAFKDLIVELIAQGYLTFKLYNTVAKPFYFNGIFLKEGEIFCNAESWKIQLEWRKDAKYGDNESDTQTAQGD